MASERTAAVGIDVRGVTLVVRRVGRSLPESKNKSKNEWRCGSAFSIFELDAASGSWHLRYLRKTRRLSGTDVLDAAERCCRALGGRRLSLQDQATKRCGVGGGEHDLLFLSQLTTDASKTWYERRGYVVSEGARHVRSAERWMEAYRRIPAQRMALAVEKQVSRLADADGRRAVEEIVPLTWAFNSAPPAFHKYKFEESELPWLLWHRRRLLRLLRAAPEGATLGSWLPTLACHEYAAFMLDAYGARADGRSPAIFAHDGCGGRTPSVEEFVRANAARRWAYKIEYAKDL